jgi:transcription elongation factor Elf1
MPPDRKANQVIPCPFCGEKEIEVERQGNGRQSHIVVCTNCGCRLESNESDGSNTAWDTRSDEAVKCLQEEIASLKGMIAKAWDESASDKSFFDFCVENGLVKI